MSLLREPFIGSSRIRSSRFSSSLGVFVISITPRAYAAHHEDSEACSDPGKVIVGGASVLASRLFGLRLCLALPLAALACYRVSTFVVSRVHRRPTFVWGLFLNSLAPRD